ncbi:hypothetical protein ACFQ08_17690, partial [Streptosporangium algeriense]
MHSVRGRRGHVVAVASGLACCLVTGVEAGSGATAWAQARNGPTAGEVAEARSKAVERSKQLNDATIRLEEARRRLRELVALERAEEPASSPVETSETGETGGTTETAGAAGEPAEAPEEPAGTALGAAETAGEPA